MCPASHSERSRTSSSCGRSARLPSGVELLQAEPRDALDRELLLAPAGHAAGQVSGDVGDADRGRELDRPARVLVVAAHEHERLLGPREPRQPRAEAGAQRGDADRAGDVRLVELQLGAHVHDAARRRVSAWSTWRGVSGWTSTVSARSGPRLSATMLRKFGGCGRAPAVGAGDELVLVVDLEQALVRALEADRRRDLQVHPGPAAHRAAEVPRPDLAVVSGSVSSRSCSERKMPCAPSFLSTARSGRAMSPTNRRVAGQHGPGSVAAGGVDQRERGVLGPVAGVCSARTVSAPSSSSQPSSNGSCS